MKAMHTNEIYVDTTTYKLAAREMNSASNKGYGDSCRYMASAKGAYVSHIFPEHIMNKKVKTNVIAGKIGVPVL